MIQYVGWLRQNDNKMSISDDVINTGIDSKSDDEYL